MRNVAALEFLKGINERDKKEGAYISMERNLKSAFDLSVSIEDSAIRAQLAMFIVKAWTDLKTLKP